MKTYTIFKGWHLSTFIPCFFRMKNNRVKRTYKVVFDDSCKYQIDEPSCVNKLFGWCYGITGVHTQSDRVGWTYNNETGKIDIWVYIYSCGKLYKKSFWSVDLNKEVEITLESIYTDNDEIRQIFITVDNQKEEFGAETDMSRRWICTLGFYFGGNTTAPHKMQIHMK